MSDKKHLLPAVIIFYAASCPNGCGQLKLGRETEIVSREGNQLPPTHGFCPKCGYCALIEECRDEINKIAKFVDAEVEKLVAGKKPAFDYPVCELCGGLMSFIKENGWLCVPCDIKKMIEGGQDVSRN